jgi:hypothetical protein
MSHKVLHIPTDGDLNLIHEKDDFKIHVDCECTWSYTDNNVPPCFPNGLLPAGTYRKSAVLYGPYGPPKNDQGHNMVVKYSVTECPKKHEEKHDKSRPMVATVHSIIVS